MALDQKFIAHVVVETAVMAVITVYFVMKNRHLNNEMARLSYKVDAMGKILEAQGEILKKLAPREVERVRAKLAGGAPSGHLENFEETKEANHRPLVPPVAPGPPLPPAVPPPPPSPGVTPRDTPTDPGVTPTDTDVTPTDTSAGPAPGPGEEEDLDELLSEELGELKMTATPATPASMTES
jgi:hypothetical protein